ncbi:hypothetical protein RUM44_012350 [Polyplax serrata]|uniref:Uncharacterized protein n=1 Tax=Polyplax serrata TaxID=468196 RepID=A0ABR1BB18_POLSC
MDTNDLKNVASQIVDEVQEKARTRLSQNGSQEPDSTTCCNAFALINPYCVEQCSSETISCDDLCDLDCRAEDPFDKESSEPRYRLEDGRRLTKVPPRWDPIDHTWFNSSRREKCSSSMSFLTTSENCPRNQKRKYRK